MRRIGTHVLKAALPWLGAIALALPLAACGRGGDPAAAPARADAQPSGMALHDQEILARRGWARAALSFGPPEPAGTGGQTFDGLGPFRIGMSLDAARSAARRAHLASNGQFGGNGVAESAWCAPPIEPAGAALILAPKELDFNGYRLEFTPVDSRLRLSSIYRSSSRQVHARDAQMRRLGRGGDARAFAACELTFAESGRLLRWDALENSELVDSLGYPEMDKDRLPAAVRATIDRWERSVTVPYDDCCDGYALTPGYDGHWRSGGDFVIGYTLAIGGFGPHQAPYVLVIGPAANIVWNGAMAEYVRHGREGRQQGARQIE